MGADALDSRSEAESQGCGESAWDNQLGKGPQVLLGLFQPANASPYEHLTSQDGDSK